MPKKRQPKKCAYCDNIFEPSPFEERRGFGLFCTNDCYLKARQAAQPGRVCSVCGEYKDADAFGIFKTKSGLVRLRPQCRECKRVMAREQYRANRAKHLEYRLRLVGLSSWDEYDALLEQQDGRCAICRTKDPGGTFERMLVDHDHASGLARGLLCSGCNQGLGRFRDDPELLRAAVVYLSDPPARRLREAIA